MSVPKMLGLYVSICNVAAQPLVSSPPRIPRPLAAGITITSVLLLQRLVEEHPLLARLPLWKTMFKSYLLVQTLQSLNNLVFDPLHLDASPQTNIMSTRTAVKPSFASQLWSACKANWRWRAIGTDREAKNTPALPVKAPSRAKMISRHLLISTTCFILLDLMSSMPQPDPQVAMVAEREHLLGRLDAVSTEELLFRAAATVGFWIGTFLGVNAFYSSLAVVAMVFFESDPAVWRPAFGDVREAYSVRRFWGIFWHQMLRNPLAGPVQYLVEALYLPPKSLFTRYFKLHAVFLSSGVFHLVADQSLGVATEQSGSLWFFQISAVAITFEDAVQEVCRRSGLLLKWPKLHYLGFLWVLFFLVMVTPPWSYPQARVGAQMVLLPLNVAAKISSLI